MGLLGIAVAAPQGLVVPVVRDADRRTVQEIARARADLVGRALRLIAAGVVVAGAAAPPWLCPPPQHASPMLTPKLRG